MVARTILVRGGYPGDIRSNSGNGHDWTSCAIGIQEM